MPDSRRDGVSDDNKSGSTQTYPCVKCIATIDAPLDDVCSFLADKDNVPLYNELVVGHRDVEEITPHSKITWCQSPKIMCIKPRDFVTFCYHRWRKDGAQVIVNQAVEHETLPGVMNEKDGDVCRAFALRGANFITRHPDDPDKTIITILGHADPGGGLPQWVMSTAVNAVVQIEPFRLFHNINKGVCDCRSLPRTEMVMNLPGRSTKAAGMSQLGYGCFWPNGGGLIEGPFSQNRLVGSIGELEVSKPYTSDESHDENQNEYRNQEDES